MKFISGLFIGALLAGGIFYFVSKKNNEKERDAFVAASESAMPTAMNINEPKPGNEDEKLIIDTSSAVTLLLAGNNEIYYYKGAFNGSLQKTDFPKVGELIRQYNAELESDKLMFIIKTDKDGTFKNAVTLIDEMAKNKVAPGHYAEIEITEAEINSINILKKTKNG